MALDDELVRNDAQIHDDIRFHRESTIAHLGNDVGFNVGACDLGNIQIPSYVEEEIAVREFSVGDVIRKKIGTTFSNDRHFATIERIEEDIFPDRIWLKETGTSISSDLIELANINEEAINVEQRRWTPEDMIIAGQYVMLDPTSNAYNYLINELNNCEKGHVITHNASEGDLLVVMTKGSYHMPGWSVIVQFDNGQKRTVHIRDLTPLAGHKTITEYRLAGGRKIYVEKGGSLEELDYEIINNEGKITRTITFDEAFRENAIKLAHEKINSGTSL